MRKLFLIPAALSGILLAGGALAYGNSNHYHDDNDDHRYSERMTERISAQLTLTADQQRLLDNVNNAMRAMHDNHEKQDMMSQIHEQLVNKKTYDQAAVNTMIQTHQQQMTASMQAMNTSFADFYNSLDAKQRDTMAAMVQKMSKQHMSRHHH